MHYYIISLLNKPKDNKMIYSNCLICITMTMTYYIIL